MRILLLGKNGQVGWELQRALAPLGELLALARDSAPLAADLGCPEALVATVRHVRPDIIVNAAAYTAVDRAEREPALARAVNAIAPAVLAREAAMLGATLVHFSTDYVFDGSGSAPRDESARTAPINVYGESKLEGEMAIRASGCRHLILRSSWVHAARGSNFAKTVLCLAAEREHLEIVDDQIGAPTGAELLADVTAHALWSVRQEPSLAGTYHVTAGGETSRHAYALFVIERARAHGHPLNVAADAVRPVPTSVFPTRARRPLNSRLDTGRLQSRFGLRLPPWQEGVERLLIEVLGH
ncbi:dTDP-4-dehydrorhamnose reductase [Methylibium petroleiphilum]|uniref:dTDP-4-dehydrorhamnose reductase n=1 Tax=Methylibium petroleiphilum (strain ATCC BAA-1232 / LMG 22953 / PM1) TaxID=420662 RepID=A2SDF0_METPP|nr:dTDP-4-dehydrorhamnose reductase [Methylibium petroleiphilum]ABM93589.1 dTDP-4-dehydrorhamnose reductase [Methylibium petroleiphilum PM1]